MAFYKELSIQLLPKKTTYKLFQASASPHFIITPLSGFFSFIITFIAIGICIYTIGYIKE
ncbi:hypothetical protein, partial [Campylobacter fetus]|uniref:hypothetical protein n=1 Tax=Campylobacter fetus TaxID=196 RepID=UPI003D3112C4